MYRPVVLFIGLRYVCGYTADNFSRFISWVSTISIMLGVMALVTVLSVMNGFERELEDSILSLVPQAIISSLNGSVNPQQLSKNNVKQLRGVNDAAPLTISDVIIQSSSNVSVGIMLGIDPTQKDPLTQYLINVKQINLKPGKYNIILGKQLAEQLCVNIGDKLRIMEPFNSQFTPIGRFPIQRLFNVIGTFSANSEVDSYQTLVNINDASKFMHYPQGNITGWRLWLNDPMKVDELSQQKLPEGTTWQDWRTRKGELFQAVRMEKNIVGLLFSLIIAVALFNIVTFLSLAVMEKQSEVAILQTQGLTPHQIMIIFIIQGASSGIIGTLIGAIIGILLANQLNSIIPILSSIFNTTVLPVDIKPIQVIKIILTTIAIALISTLYPSWRAIAIQPANALRYE